MRCPACARENPEGARFCNACAAPLTQLETADADTGIEATGAAAVVPTTGRPPEAPPSPTLTAESLQRYLPEALAEKIRSLGHLESERRHVTVVFADISGFTAMSEQLDAEEVTQVINGCFQALVEVVFRYEGAIDKFIGDEIMALFGAPIAHENDPERAVRAALEMQERLRQFNETLTTPLPKPLTLHVGINSGEVIAGNVGSDLRMDYSVLGDTVNLAARLEGASPSGQIWVSERTHALTRHLFEYKALKPLKLQGKQRKVQAYQVLGVKATPERGRGVAEGYGSLVGREAELARLRVLAEQVQAGQGRVLGVVGDAGIGKSRLVYELQQLVAGWTVASGACVSYEVPAPYQVFTELLRSLLGVRAEDEEGVVRQRLESWVMAKGLDRDSVLPPLGSLFGLRDEGWLYLADEEKLSRLKAALVAVCRAAATGQPLLLVLEDLHWVDPASRALLEQLVPEVGSLPVLLCCVHRPEFQPGWKEGLTCQILPVGPLPPEQVVELSQVLLKLHLPPELEHLVVSRAEGNPFFVEELLKALVDEGVIAKTRTRYELKQDVSSLKLPDTMQGVILARLDRLEAQARETLQYASVIGRRFSHALLEAVSPRAAQVETHLQQLQRLELVYQHRILSGLEYIFKHFVIREVAYGNLLVKRRKVIHLEVAKAIERVYRGRLEEYYEVLAHHFEAGEDWQKAADYYGKAGSRAREVHTDAGADALVARRDRAARALHEQREGRHWGRVVGITFGVASMLLLVTFEIWLSGWGGLGLAGSYLFLWFSLWRLVAARRVDALTVYADRLLIRSQKKAITIAFASIRTVHWSRLVYGLQSRVRAPERVLPERREESRWRRVRQRLFPRSAPGELVLYGSYRYWTGWRDRWYYGQHDGLRITRLDGPWVLVDSEHVPELYRELKLALTRWAAATQAALPVIDSEASRLAEHHQVPLRRGDGAHLGSVACEQLVAMAAKREVTGADQVGFWSEVLDGEFWVALDEVSRGDPQLRAALRPWRYGFGAWCRNPIIMILVLCVPLLSVVIPVAIDGSFARLPAFLAPGVWLLLATASVYLGIGVAEWAKHLRLQRAERIALTVGGAGGLLAALSGLGLLAWLIAAHFWQLS